jgi:hypothetical protein
VVLSFDGEISNEAIADYKQMIDSINHSVISSTQQLRWNYGSKGYFTINTNGTQGFVGCAKGEVIDLQDVQLKTNNEFAVVLASSLQKGKTLKQSGSILITCMARARNTGMKFNEDHSQLLDVGKAPILLEPVDVSLRVKNKKFTSLYLWIILVTEPAKW